MLKFSVVFLHKTGLRHAEWEEIEGSNREEVLHAAQCTGASAQVDRYLARIYSHSHEVDVYVESSGWTRAADDILPN